jgi:hypothetical protein
VRHYLKKTLHRKRAGGVSQVVSPELKLQYCKKKKKKKKGSYNGEKTKTFSKSNKMKV